MIEVEVKILLSEKELALLKEKIKKIARFESRQVKIDDYYTLQREGYPKKSLRIRRKKHLYEINFKHSISFKRGIHAKSETEFHVDRIPDFLNLIRDFGYRFWLRKEKLSEVYEVERNLHIELNKVKHLGWFMELECLVKRKQDIEQARRKIENALVLLELDKRERIKKGYTIQLWEKKHKL
jgi:predicted adenylyl cyclase CyaB